ncbi:hypothetical protein Peur_024155 [Populus x canadensis]
MHRQQLVSGPGSNACQKMKGSVLKISGRPCWHRRRILSNSTWHIKMMQCGPVYDAICDVTSNPLFFMDDLYTAHRPGTASVFNENVDVVDTEVKDGIL